jgi:hypothetical protein
MINQIRARGLSQTRETSMTGTSSRTIAERCPKASRSCRERHRPRNMGSNLCPEGGYRIQPRVETLSRILLPLRGLQFGPSNLWPEVA